jgi:hypothetical protein
VCLEVIDVHTSPSSFTLHHLIPLSYLPCLPSIPSKFLAFFSLGEREFYWGRRYFSSEDTPRSGAVGERPLRYPTAILAARIPRDREGLIRQIGSVSRDLCILYCRMAVFRILRSFSKLKDKKIAFLELLMARRPIVESLPISPSTSTNNILLESPCSSSDAPADAVPPTTAQTQCEDLPFQEGLPVQESSPMDQILVLIRQSCVSTQRTKIYLQTVAMLHSVSHLPQNIGSVFGAGGAPMLEQLRHSMSDMLSLSLSLNTTSVRDKSASAYPAHIEAFDVVCFVE